ncbi:hypothetical protein H0H81_006664 [Sphagnurus paluster]|uniref:AB hydrolase-1 domain-containing protein n=1 Tax=Sphagnurus paluster TaxID=117069 RepID=A0A9P7FXV7_9AGAR|nr:hypothetical protein H0H81_006664 [Sphagnurus paluster]
MDSSLYKFVVTRRQLKYNYYHAAPATGKPVLLFLHGFPNTSNDWRHQVTFFKDRGFGLIVPDMLGYGGTDKPIDYTEYRLSAIAHDIIDILDAEKVDKAIAIGHDWGSIVVSRLANYYPDRFLGFGFLAGGYSAPSSAKFEESIILVNKLIGRELLGYWLFFNEDDAHKILEKNFDSFYSIVVPEDPALWVSNLSPTGALKAWVEEDKRTAVLSCLTEEEVRYHKQALLQGGLQAPLNWYRARVRSLDAEDNKDVTPENIFIHKPVFFGAATHDMPALGKASCEKFAKGPLTINEFNASHWLMWEKKEEVNEKLLEWIQGL